MIVSTHTLRICSTIAFETLRHDSVQFRRKSWKTITLSDAVISYGL